MSPSAYKKRYERIQVPLPGGKTEDVCVDQYRLPGLPKHDVNQAAVTAFFNMLDKHGVDVQVTVGWGTPAFGYLPRPGDLSSNVEERKKEEKVNGPTETRKRVAVIARYVFKGKGMTSHQIVKFKVAPL